MKKILLISILILIAFSLKATQYYVATTGSNGANGLTVGTAWQTVAYACTTVPTGAHTINIAAGTYNEGNNIMNLKVGVSLIGAGAATTIINSTYHFATSTTQELASLKLVSSTPNTNGNQTISHLTLDGGDGIASSATRAISIHNRGGVKVLYCIIKDFFTAGVMLSHGNIYSYSPTLVLNDGNEIAFNTIDNCTDCSGSYDGWALIYIGGQKNLLIHDNLLYSNKRVGAHNGNILNAGAFRYNGCKYYNNQSWKPNYNSSWATNNCGVNGYWNFHLEIWENDGGFEIYNNTFTGGQLAIDIAGRGVMAMTSDHSFDFRIYGNTIKQNGDVYNGYETGGILIEADTAKKTYIYDNTIIGFKNPIRVSTPRLTDLYIFDNSFLNCQEAIIIRRTRQGPASSKAIVATANNINIYRNKIWGKASTATSEGLFDINAVEGCTSTNFNIYNNTLVADASLDTRGIQITVWSTCSFTNLNIKNNILAYCRSFGTLRVNNSGTINQLHIENNFSYNLANANALISYAGTAPTNTPYQLNNLPTSNTTQASPLFINEATQNYNLQAGSPCVNTGQVVSIDGANLTYSGTFPDRGYAEYSTGTTLPTVTLIGNTVTGSGSLAWDCSTTNAGGGTITERGICWGTSTTPTTATNKIVDGSGLGSYSINITGLLPVTTYYVRAYAINQAGTAYSAEQTASTDAEGTAAISPTVFIDSVNTISINGATVHYQLFDDGGGTISEKGICWNTSPTPTTANSKLTNVQSGISYTTAITTLTANTLYYIRAYAINEGGTGYSSETPITTLASGSVVEPAITLVGLSYVTSRAISLVGQVTDNGGGNVTERGFCYSLSPNPTIANSKILNGTGIGYYYTLVEKLNPTTLYYFRAYSINEAGVSYSDQLSVSTSVMKAISSGTGKTIMYKGKIVKY